MQFSEVIKVLNFKTSYKLASCAVLVVISDFLFYDQYAGWTLGLFGLLLFLAAFIHNGVAAGTRLSNFAAVALLGLISASMESPSWLAWWMYFFTIMAFVLLPRLARRGDARALVGSVLTYGFAGWGRLFRDAVMGIHIRIRRKKQQQNHHTLLRNWLLPVFLSVVFILLFASANPIIAGWLEAINWHLITEYLSVPRLLFWLAVAAGCWAIIRPKIRVSANTSKTSDGQKVEFTLPALLFNERSILTSLILFNIIFLVQNSFDLAYLWRGAVLPQGMTYAQYAHRGAYPLIVTALLAGAFVLVALKPGSPTERLLVIRALVYVWVAQNVFLVLSSILRLLGYIAEYSLTYLRVEALIWMGLVALGLILIVGRIYLKKSNAWLLNGNGIALYVTLFICCFINFGEIIANYNVRHCSEAVTAGKDGATVLDLDYLNTDVGVAAIPALKWFERNHANSPKALDVTLTRQHLQRRLGRYMTNWRRWTFRNYRLLQSV